MKKKSVDWRSIFEQEQRASRSMSVQDHANTRLNTAIRRVKRQQAVLTSLAQQGITWDDLKKAYDDAFSKGEKEILEFVVIPVRIVLTLHYTGKSTSLHLEGHYILSERSEGSYHRTE